MLAIPAGYQGLFDYQITDLIGFVNQSIHNQSTGIHRFFAVVYQPRSNERASLVSTLSADMLDRAYLHLN